MRTYLLEEVYAEALVSVVATEHLSLQGWLNQNTIDRWQKMVRKKDIKLRTFSYFSRLVNMLNVKLRFSSSTYIYSSLSRSH